MKKPLYNKNERWQIININCLDTSFKKLNIALLHFKRKIQKGLGNPRYCNKFKA